MPLIEARSVRKDYQAGATVVSAVRDVDLSIDGGEFVAVWGPSGSGKTSLCNLIGLLDTPTRGQLSLDGVDSASLSDNQRSDLRNQRIGFVFQRFNLVPVLSALENVMLPRQIRGDSAGAAEKAAAVLLERVGLGEHMHHRPDKLSGGQQQRVALARALVGEPALVLADEPTANLDTNTALSTIDLMRELNHERGVTFVFSTHDQRLLDAVDRRVQLADGQIREDVRA